MFWQGAYGHDLNNESKHIRKRGISYFSVASMRITIGAISLDIVVPSVLLFSKLLNNYLQIMLPQTPNRRNATSEVPWRCLRLFF